ncbi:leucine-rich repeat domain-containing protein [Dactylosporangium sp. NPDC000244]|uniref:leucine-rich repeat domain-containing protein n=1 Tax=Dactylosporangium sp. NPDC000244 TaxID=3154365 RepID=UPI0033190442
MPYTYLALGRIQLTVLPDSLGNLTALTILYLSHNRLTVLPETLGNLTSLTELYMSRNELATLPESLANLTALTTLYIGENKLRWTARRAEPAHRASQTQPAWHDRRDDIDGLAY